MVTVVVFFLILGLLVLVHEFGHFIVAKKNGIKVEEFGFGIPPRIFGIKKGETLYSINALPFGGFVKLYGEEERESHKEREFIHARAFSHKKPWQKATVIVAGVIGNLLLGWVLISYLVTQGVPIPTKKVIVEQVQKNSPAEKAGLKTNDVVLKIKESEKIYELHSSSDLISLTKKFGGKQIILVIERKNKEREFIMTPRIKPPANQGSLGIIITSFVIKKYPWYSAPYYGLIEAFSITKQIAVELFKMFYQFITFKNTKVDVAGPIGIARFTGQAIKLGNNAVLELIALLSLNLAVLNILPFPALDGGRLVFVFYEWITKKRVNYKIEQYVNIFGMVVLLSLVFLISVHDILNIYK